MDIVTGMGCVVGGLIGIMLSVYIALCFTSWISDIYDNQKRRWRK